MRTLIAHRGEDELKSSGVGFLLLDCSLKLIYANREAVEILTYPEKPQAIRSLDRFLMRKIGSELSKHPPSPSRPWVAPLLAGKRRYVCRAFSVGSFTDSPKKSSLQPYVALLIERGTRGGIDLSEIAEKFHLTKRERETVQFLLLGLTTKEIGNEMEISPNTVKAFLRFIMSKMSVSTRSGILGKILLT